jgi:uncharacterized RDD family membrane protein YckC
MRCAECGELLDVETAACPFCRKPDATNRKEDPERPAPPTVTQADAPAMTENSNASSATTQDAPGSTLIEFPGVNRKRPAWRKELSERFREIQQRRAREADLDAEEELLDKRERADSRAEQAATARATPDDARASAQLGLVPTPDEPEINPIVAAALRRIERARSREHAPHVTRGGSHRTHGPATAAARVFDERPETLEEQAAEAQAEQARATPLVVVPPSRPAESIIEAKTEIKPAEAGTNAPAAESRATAPAVEEKAAQPKPEAPAVAESKARASEGTTKAAAARAQTPQAQAEEARAESRQPRHISGVLDEFWLERQGIELLPKVAEPEVTYDDRAPRAKRFIAGVVDLFIVALICAPFAAAIELTISNWGDPRVWGSMAAIAATAMFLYHTCALALAGRTAGMSLCSLHAVDARKACVPTTGQCARRALVYMLSLATLGLGLLYSLFDAEGRAAHDILSGTVVVRQ